MGRRPPLNLDMRKRAPLTNEDLPHVLGAIALIQEPENMNSPFDCVA